MVGGKTVGGKTVAKHILVISNGHGEDLNASLVAQALMQADPSVQVSALAIVGAGNAYRRLGIPLIAPTQTMPSGGIFYTSQVALAKDLVSGLPLLTWQQILAARAAGSYVDLVLATGDIVPVSFARLTGRPYCSFIVSTSSYYEGQLHFPWFMERLLRSPRCRRIFTRDAFTAQDLNQRGIDKALFAGYPIMDTLSPTGKDLALIPDVPMVALLPGSRLPEACHNLVLQLQLCRELVQWQPIQFRAALIPAITETELVAAVQAAGCDYRGEGVVAIADAPILRCYRDAFPDILQQCHLAIGMAGTAVEQAVGLGKPVVQIPGRGPQFTYRFADAQMRLLGTSVQTVGDRPATPAILQQAAQTIIRTLQNKEYLQTCLANGKERVGAAGGSAQLAQQILSVLCGL
jgi:uncharacterized protein (TIGR03492 family)